jgi:parallel beta-helix repeat protein
MKTKRFLAIIFSIALLTLMSVSINAAECGGAVACECGDTVVESYTMTEDLIDCPVDGLDIGADDVTLDCAGNKIFAFVKEGAEVPEELPPEPTKTGIEVKGHSNVGIRNCEVRYFDVGVHILPDHKTQKFSSQVVVRDSVVRNNLLTGVDVLEASNVFFRDNILSRNNLNGLRVAGGSNVLVEGNRANFNNKDGISLTDVTDSVINGNTANGNEVGIRADQFVDGRITDNVANDNDITSFGTGFSFYELENTVVHDNKAKNNKNALVVNRGKDSSFKDNIFNRNERYGFYLFGDDNRVSRNIISQNDARGLQVAAGSGNTIDRNVFFQNAVNAYEASSVSENEWDFEGTGNHWSDYRSNPGRSSGHYVVYGAGNGIDWFPLLDFEMRG